MGIFISKTNDGPQKDTFCKKYKLGPSIATGTFAKVRRCTRIEDGEEFAVKIVKKKDCTANEILLLQDEIDIYSSIKHPHIINMDDFYMTNNTVQMVMELCDDQTLSDMMYFAPNGRLSESECAHIVEIIASTLKYLHSEQIIHRDLKPENILFSKDSVIKIADFGSAFTKINRSYYEDHSVTDLSLLEMNTMIGTPNYVAPEILRGASYSYRVDLWSLGVILFECIAGYHPFSTRKTRKSIHALYGAIMCGKYKMEAVWDNIDEDATDLMQKLIVVDPQKRITADDVLKHPFIVKHAGNNTFAAGKGKESSKYDELPINNMLQRKGGLNCIDEGTALQCNKMNDSCSASSECVLYPVSVSMVIEEKKKSNDIQESSALKGQKFVEYAVEFDCLHIELLYI